MANTVISISKWKKMKENICKNVQGKVIPEINWNKCESDELCAKACPHQVLKMEKITKQQYSKLTFFGKLKTHTHSWKKAMVVNPEQCFGCGICLNTCPEGAIKLIRCE